MLRFAVSGVEGFNEWLNEFLVKSTAERIHVSILASDVPPDAVFLPVDVIEELREPAGLE